MTSDTRQLQVPNDSPGELRQLPPQFALWHVLIVMLCTGIVLAGWRENVRLLPWWQAMFFVVVIVGGTTLLLWVFGRWMRSRAENSVALLIAAVLFASLAPRPIAYGWSGRSQCRNHLKQIGVALHTYHDIYQCFPPAFVADENGRPMHSWRVLLLPFLEQQPLYAQYRFDEPWDGPNNSRLHKEIMEVYRCPGIPADPVKPDDVQTSYVVIVGQHTAFPDDMCVSLDGIQDKHDRTLLVVEVENSGIHWLEPRDLHVTQMATQINARRGQGIASKHAHGAQVLFADGSVHYLSKDNPPAVLRKLITIDDGEPSFKDW